MGKAAVYTWAASDAVAICQPQTTTGAANLVLNGNLSNTGIAAPIYWGGNVQRSVTLTSTANNSGVNVTITGTLNGAVVSTTHAGPNNNTISLTTFLVDAVTSVSVSGAVTGMGVGSGTNGQTQPFIYDFHAPYAALTVQVDVTGTVEYVFTATLDDVNTNPNPYVYGTIVAPNPGSADSPYSFQQVMGSGSQDDITGATESAIANINYPIRACWITVQSTTGSFVTTIIQQGIK